MPDAPGVSTLYVEPRLPRWWDRAIIVATVVTLAVVLFDFTLDPDSSLSVTLGWLDFTFCLLFAMDFALRMKQAPRRWHFFKRNWPDLIGAIPFVGPLRGARLLRLMRLVRLTRMAMLVRRLLVYLQVPIPTRALVYLGGVAVGWWALAAVVFTLFETGINNNVSGFGDSLWWSITTLSTVGYGDLYPVTLGGRIVAAATMALGVGILGTFGGAIATVFLDAREQGRRGRRSLIIKDHLLVLGWNDKARSAIREFHADKRYAETRVVIVAELEESPLEQPNVRFVSGRATQREVLTRAAAHDAGAAIIFARDPTDARSDHEAVLVAMAVRRMNRSVRISAELVDPENREYLIEAGCDAVIAPVSVASAMLVQGVQDVGVPELVMDLLCNDDVGSQIYRVPVDSTFVGKTYRDYAIASLDKSRTLLAIARGRRVISQPDAALRLEEGDHAFMVASEPPR